MPIVVPKEVKISCDASKVEVTGPKGHLLHLLPQGITVSMDEGKILVQRPNDQRTSRSLQGLTRSLIANMVTGVTQGFEKKLEIVGVGFRADVEGKALKLSLGFSHPVSFPLPEGIRAEVEKQTLITVKGIDDNRSAPLLQNCDRSNPRNPTRGKGSVMPESGFARKWERPKPKED